MMEQKFILNKPMRVEETRHYEFKEVQGHNPVDSIKNKVDEYVVAFLNGEGGRIYWGIRDSDRVIVGVRLTYEERDRLRRSVTEQLIKIQPPIAPSAYRIVLHEVYCEDGSAAVSDLFVIEVIVPRVFTRSLFFTGGNEAFVKTDAGKKKLTGLEQYDEIRRRLIHEEEIRFANQNTLTDTALETKRTKRWRGLEQCLSLASIDSQQAVTGYGSELALCLYKTFSQSGYIRFNGMLRLEQVNENNQFFRLYNLICHQIEFCAVVNQRETDMLETTATIKEQGSDERGRNWEEARADVVREMEAFESEWNINVSLSVTDNFLPVEFIYDPPTRRISVQTIRRLSGNPDDYPDRVTTTSEVLHYIASMANGCIGIFDDFNNPDKQNYPLLKLVFAASKNEFDLNNLRLNAANYEEWDYINNAFNDKILTHK